MNEPSNRRLAETLGSLALTLHSQPTSDATLRTIANAVVDLIPESSWAGISLVRGRKVTAAVPTDAVAKALDELQSALGEGPVFDALREERALHLPDFNREKRWPKFVAAATKRGVHSMLSFRLYIDDAGTLGALNVYGATPGVFSEDSIIAGELLAQHAAVALAGATAQEQLQRAMASRDVIGQAKGILMNRDNLTGLQAFAALTRASQDTNLKLVDVATWLVGQQEERSGSDATGQTKP